MKLGDGVTFDETPLQIQCHPYLVYPFSKTEIGVGCIVHEIDYWIKSDIPEELAAHPECLPWDAYKKAIIMLAEWMAQCCLPVTPFGLDQIKGDLHHEN
jgi:hypothetical protein